MRKREIATRARGKVREQGMKFVRRDETTVLDEAGGRITQGSRHQKDVQENGAKQRITCVRGAMKGKPKGWKDQGER